MPRTFHLKSLLLCVTSLAVSCGMFKLALTTSDSGLRPVAFLIGYLALGGTIGALFGDPLAGVGYSFALLMILAALAVFSIVIWFLVWG